MCTAALVAALALGAPDSVAADWQQPTPGNLTNFDDASPDPPAIASIGGVAHIVWSELNSTYHSFNSALFVKKLTPSGWAFVGSGSVGAGLSEAEVGIADVGGVPHVIWQAWNDFGPPPNGSDNQVHVRKFGGTNWVDVGSILNQDPTHKAFNPVIAGIGGVPYAAFIENDTEPINDPANDTQLYVKRFVSGSWQLVGAGPLNIDPVDEDAYAPHILGIGGVPYVVFSENGQTYVKRFNANTSLWEEPDPGSLNIDGAAATIRGSLADVGGVPHVAWMETNGAGPTQTFVKRLVGNTWTQVGSGPAESDPTKDGGGRIATVDGALWIAINQFTGTTYLSQVRRLIGSNWVTVGSNLNVDTAMRAIQPRLTDTAGAPFAVWREGDGNCTFTYNQSNTCRVFAKCLDCVSPPPPPDNPKCVGPGCSPTAPIDPLLAHIAGIGKVKITAGRFVLPVTCNGFGIPCTVALRPAASIPPIAARTFKLKRVKRTVQAGKTKRITVKFSKKLRRKIKRARRAGKRVRLTVRVDVSKKGGRKETFRRKATLKPLKR